MQEKVSNMGFCCIGYASVPLSAVIPRVGNAHLQQNPISDLCPPTEGEGGGTYCFCCGSRRRRPMRRRDTFLLARYLMNYWVEYNQICMDITLGQDEERIRFS